MVDQIKEKVLITGVTGYIASQVTSYFLNDGGFDIRGTVRDPSNAEKLAPLKKAFGEENFAKIEFARADLLDAESIDKAVSGCKYVVHCASPLPTK
jgi:nucleoside-diphosphate-sugar epimerase